MCVGGGGESTGLSPKQLSCLMDAIVNPDAYFLTFSHNLKGKVQVLHVRKKTTNATNIFAAAWTKKIRSLLKL